MAVTPPEASWCPGSSLLPAEDEGDGGNLDGPEHDHGEVMPGVQRRAVGEPVDQAIGVLAEEEREQGPGQRRPQLFAHAMRNRNPTAVPVATTSGSRLPATSACDWAWVSWGSFARMLAFRSLMVARIVSATAVSTTAPTCIGLTATSMDRSDRGSPGRSRTQSALPSMSRHSVSAQRAVRQGPRQNCLRERQAMSRRVTFSLMEGPIAEDDGDPRSLRVSDRERDHAVGRLKDAVSEGLIDIEEFGDRTSQALVARTRGELDAVTSDLPAGADAGPGTDDIVELKGSMSSLERKGSWKVPRKLVLRWRMGSVKLDFAKARIVHPVVEIELDVSGGSVEIRLPEGASASLDGVEARLGSIEDHRRGAPAAGRPHFVLKGQISWGSVEVRGPRRSWSRRQRKTSS